MGGVIGGAANLQGDLAQGKVNELVRQWLDQYEARIRSLEEAIAYIVLSIDRQEDPSIDERINTEEYLQIVRHGFRIWDEADTSAQRKRIQDLLSHAACTHICSDDVIRLFLSWLEQYSDLHFKVIGAVYQHPMSTRAQIRQSIGGAAVRDDSSDADLFKLLIRDINIGGIIRQPRETTSSGQHLKKKRTGPRGTASSVMESAFENTKPWELTQLGSQFVHYAMTAVVPKIRGDNST